MQQLGEELRGIIKASWHDHQVLTKSYISGHNHERMVGIMMIMMMTMISVNDASDDGDDYDDECYAGSDKHHAFDDRNGVHVLVDMSRYIATSIVLPALPSAQNFQLLGIAVRDWRLVVSYGL